MKWVRAALSFSLQSNRATSPAVRCVAGGLPLSFLGRGIRAGSWPASGNNDSTQGLAFAVVKARGRENSFRENSFSLNPFRAVNRGPDVYSLVTVRTEIGDSGCLKGVQDSSTQEKLIQACIGQGSLRFSGVLSSGDYKHATGQHGKQNEAKLVPGAVIAANLGLGFYVTASDIHLSANVGQGYGKIVQVLTSPDGHIQSADVLFDGAWSEMWSESVQLHYLTDGGFYANVPADRLLAHAIFRNVFMTTTLDYLQWEMALLWPETVSLEDIVFVDAHTGAAIPKNMPKRIRSLLEGEVAVEICGQRVPVLDPTLAVKPQTLNLAITSTFAVGGIFFLSGMCVPAAAWLACPVGAAAMVLAAVIERGWQHMALEERSRFAEELESTSGGWNEPESGAKR